MAAEIAIVGSVGWLLRCRREHSAHLGPSRGCTTSTLTVHCATAHITDLTLPLLPSSCHLLELAYHSSYQQVSNIVSHDLINPAAHSECHRWCRPAHPRRLEWVRHRLCSFLLTATSWTKSSTPSPTSALDDNPPCHCRQPDISAK